MQNNTMQLMALLAGHEVDFLFNSSNCSTSNCTVTVDTDPMFTWKRKLLSQARYLECKICPLSLASVA